MVIEEITVAARRSKCVDQLWASTQLLPTVTEWYADVLDTPRDEITVDTRFSELGTRPLDIELVLELQDKFDVKIPDERADQLHTNGDVVRCIEDYRHGTTG